MGITDELREYIWQHATNNDELRAIADRIDAEHEKAIRELNNLADASVLLPVDADGEYIHVWDVVDVMPTDKFTGHKNVVVTSVIFRHSAALVTVDTADSQFTLMPNRIRHHHAPTREDVLREFTDAVLEWAGKSGTVAEVGTWSDVAAKYAAKLRMADDGEER